MAHRPLPHWRLVFAEWGVMSIGNARPAMHALTGLPHRVTREGPLRVLAPKEPVRRPVHAPPVAQDREQRRGQHHVAILLPLPVIDAQDHPLAIDGGDREPHGFRGPEAGGVAGRQDRAMRRVCDAGEKVDDFLGAENHRQDHRLLWGRNHGVARPRALERDLTEKAECAHRDDDRTGSQLFLGGQVDQVRADLLGLQQRWGPADMTGEPGYGVHVRALGMRRQVPDLHVLAHALAKRGHRRLLCERARPIPGGRPGAYVRIGASNGGANESVGTPGRAIRGSERGATASREAG